MIVKCSLKDTENDKFPLKISVKSTMIYPTLLIYSFLLHLQHSFPKYYKQPHHCRSMHPQTIHVHRIDYKESKGQLGSCYEFPAYIPSRDSFDQGLSLISLDALNQSLVHAEALTRHANSWSDDFLKTLYAERSTSALSA